MKLSSYMESFTVTLSVCPTFVMSGLKARYCYWISLLLLHSLFSILFLVKKYIWCESGEIMWWKGFICFCACCCLRDEKSSWIKEGKKVLAFCDCLVILEQTGVGNWKGSTEDYIKAPSAKASVPEDLLSPELSAVETVILLSCWICWALLYYYYFWDQLVVCADTQSTQIRWRFNFTPRRV